MNIEIVTTNDSDILNLICKLRVEVWLSVGMSSDRFTVRNLRDEHEEHAKHWIVRKDNCLLAAARMCFHNSLPDVPNGELYYDLDKDFLAPFGSINRLVVHPQARRLGIGRRLDYVRLSEAANSGCKTVVAWWTAVSGLKRLKCLENYGFKQISVKKSRTVFPFGEVTILALSVEDWLQSQKEVA